MSYELLQPHSKDYYVSSNVSIDPEELIEKEESSVPKVHKKADSLYDYVSPLKNRATCVINSWDSRLDRAITQNLLQNKLDILGNAIENKFCKGKVKEFCKWLNSKTEGAWYKQLAYYLVKLPLKTAYNIIQMLYNLIKAICYTTVHPMKAVLKLAKMLIEFVHSLTNPEVWTKLGTGMIGASLGQALLIYNPMATLLGVVIGSALLFSSISFGALEAALTAEKGKRLSKVKSCLLNHGQHLTESMLTGFVMGVITGAIQKAIQNRYSKTSLDKEELTEEAEKFIKKNHLPKPVDVQVDLTKQNVTLRWHADQLKTYREPWYTETLWFREKDMLTVTLTKDQLPLIKVNYHFTQTTRWGHDFELTGRTGLYTDTYGPYVSYTRVDGSWTNTLQSGGPVADPFPLFKTKVCSSVDPVILSTVSSITEN